MKEANAKFSDIFVGFKKTIRYLAESIPEYKFMVYLIDKYNVNLDEYLEIVKKSITGKRSADVILTTAHKSKGLEFCSVEIANDFRPLNKSSEEEINIFYVAITRATHDLKTSSIFSDIYGATDER